MRARSSQPGHGRPLHSVLLRNGRAATLYCLLAAACQRDPGGDVAIAESIVELGDAISALQQDNALLQTQLDSLRVQVARQDTTLQRLTAAVSAALGTR